MCSPMPGCSLKRNAACERFRQQFGCAYCFRKSLSAPLLDDCSPEMLRDTGESSFSVSTSLARTATGCHIILAGCVSHAQALSAHLGQVARHAGSLLAPASDRLSPACTRALMGRLTPRQLCAGACHPADPGCCWDRAHSAHDTVYPPGYTSDWQELSPAPSPDCFAMILLLCILRFP